ncbi:hypothetical protein [Curtobacterium sp. MCBD17_008]|uniref:hypothetical protein n=1 Tax=Curtobacterium sp. MCBD17_008 TaxID=2175656 RepID=UPI000DA9A996|nr:hypothetical protein [Curtobacterium sp. MCBD17_008]PZE89954.1 hypothetical protein DEI95_13105 [Curtobacterium sp. MCBD17_008]
MTSEILTLDAAAKRIRRSKRTVEQWAANGMPTVLYGGRRYVQLTDLVTHAAAHGRRRGRARDAPRT